MSDRKLTLLLGELTLKAPLLSGGHYDVRALTRSTASEQAKKLAALPHVTLQQGSQDSQADLHATFAGAYGAWVSMNGFTLGRKASCSTEFEPGWDERYHCAHCDSKGRIGDLILGHDQESGMITSLLTTGPYMDMLFDGMFVPKEKEDGSFLSNHYLESADGKIPLIALDDVGVYSLWLFDNPSQSADLDLEVATDQVSFAEIASTFTKVTGKKGVHKRLSLNEYLDKAELYPGAYANWAMISDVPRDESFMAWRENFTAWWRYWSEGKVQQGIWH
ncbi:hypothetical protein BDW72DRAFT_198882 [Aspergillus terricola var. indicus]